MRDFSSSSIFLFRSRWELKASFRESDILKSETPSAHEIFDGAKKCVLSYQSTRHRVLMGKNKERTMDSILLTSIVRDSGLVAQQVSRLTYVHDTPSHPPKDLHYLNPCCWRQGLRRHPERERGMGGKTMLYASIKHGHRAYPRTQTISCSSIFLSVQLIPMPFGNVRYPVEGSFSKFSRPILGATESIALTATPAVVPSGIISSSLGKTQVIHHPLIGLGPKYWLPVGKKALTA